MKSSLLDESEGQIIDGSHDAAHIPDDHAGCIFTKSDVTATPAPTAGAV
jgi:hypothetical protein